MYVIGCAGDSLSLKSSVWCWMWWSIDYEYKYFSWKACSRRTKLTSCITSRSDKKHIGDKLTVIWFATGSRQWREGSDETVIARWCVHACPSLTGHSLSFRWGTSVLLRSSSRGSITCGGQCAGFMRVDCLFFRVVRDVGRQGFARRPLGGTHTLLLMLWRRRRRFGLIWGMDLGHVLFHLTAGVGRVLSDGCHSFVCDVNVLIDFGDELTIFIDHSFEFGLKNKRNKVPLLMWCWIYFYFLIYLFWNYEWDLKSFLDKNKTSIMWQCTIFYLS